MSGPPGVQRPTLPLISPLFQTKHVCRYVCKAPPGTAGHNQLISTLNERENIAYYISY